MTVVPYSYKQESKKEQVAEMFDNIAHKYDFLNHFFSLGIDVLWRKKAIRLLKKENPKTILDIASGTGDFAFEAVKLNPEKIVGADISEGMLAKGREKIKARKLQDLITLEYGDSENLSYKDESFDAVIVAFGVRNFENLEKGLKEMLRVIKKGGSITIIEFSQPKKFPVKQVFNFYFKKLVPFFGKLVSKDSSAYTYLPDSVQAFPEGDDFLSILAKTGYSKPQSILLSGGIASIYKAKRA